MKFSAVFPLDQNCHRRPPRTAAGTALLLLAWLIAVPAPAGAAGAGAGEEARLKQLRGRIEALQEKLNETRGRRDDVREEMRGLERRIGAQMNDLRKTDAQLRANEKKLADLRARAAREQGNLGAQRQQLARQVYTAYLMGRQEYPRMLLNQENPARVARVTTYYDYLNRARIERIDQIRASLVRTAALERQIREQHRELETLRAGQREQQAALEASRARRGELLASLNREVRGQSQQMERLRADEKRLEQLIEELKTVMPEPPLPPRAGTPFARLRGRLPLPTRGPLLARYGGSKNVGNLKWRGLLIGGREGQNVVSVFRGRVVFADWLRGFGLLLILDHGDGYMTLYGHNQSLHKGVGEWVEAGEIVASLGNTGDMPQPAVYFEIRQNGQPRDPLIWCRSR
ncbi:MAG: peptidoglycan DD-metalloendopeptidase family protein [Pseudomonadota bacterium]